MHLVNTGRFRFVFTQGNNAGLYFKSFLKRCMKQLKLLKCFKGKITCLFSNDMMKETSALIQFSFTLLISSC